MRFWNDRTLIATDRVVVNVWLPRVNGKPATVVGFIKALYNKTAGPGSRIGHVSLETQNIFASWWPHSEDAEQVEIFNVVRAQNSNYMDDCTSEKGPPDLRACFYSLNVTAIEDCFDNVERSRYGYVLAGDKKITRLLNINEEKGQSCCGLAYELLEAGGILKLSHFYTDLKIKWIAVTTDNFGEFIRNAKQYEWETYPETQSFPRLVDEYVPEVQPQKGCTIS